MESFWTWWNSQKGKQMKDEPTGIETMLSSVVDRGAWLIYDWIDQPPDEQTKETYICLSGLKAGRSLADTNMRGRNQFPPPQGYAVESFHPCYGRMAQEDVDQFRENYIIELIIGEKAFYQMPLVAVPPIGQLIRDGMPEPKEGEPRQPEDIRDWPRFIPALVFTSIHVIGRKTFRLSERGNGLKFLPILRGVLDRAVQ